MAAAPLTSDWGRLSKKLLASFYAVDYDGNPTENSPEVIAPIIEGGSFSMQMNWQSPFENMGPESKAPALTALIQSGALLPLQDRAGESTKVVGNVAPQLQRAIDSVGSGTDSFGITGTQSSLRDLRGVSGVTKINSTQIFSGMAPAKFSMTLLFRAWRDAYKEVEEPLRQLQKWAVPIDLAEQGAIVGNLSGEFGNLALLDISRLLPSRAPTLIAMRYGNTTFQKLVIESIEEPITSPRGKDGFYTEIAVPITLATLTALDRDDIVSAFPGRAT